MTRNSRAQRQRKVSGLTGGVTRVVVLGIDPPRRKQLSNRQAKLWAAATRRCYLGLAIGALLALLILLIAISTG